MADETFGVDASTIGGLDPTFAEVRGKRVVLERLVRRFRTARGDLDYAPDDGLDLVQWVNEATTPMQRRTLGNYMLLEAKKDEAVLDAIITMNFNSAVQRLDINVWVDTEEGPFDFTLGVNELTVQVLRDSL